MKRWLSFLMCFVPLLVLAGMALGGVWHERTKDTFELDNPLPAYLTPQQRYEMADWVFLGTLGDTRDMFPADGQRIFTLADARCSRALKGEVPRELALLFPGGSVPTADFLAAQSTAPSEDLSRYRAVELPYNMYVAPGQRYLFFVSAGPEANFADVLCLITDDDRVCTDFYTSEYASLDSLLAQFGAE